MKPYITEPPLYHTNILRWILSASSLKQQFTGRLIDSIFYHNAMSVCMCC